MNYYRQKVVGIMFVPLFAFLTSCEQKPVAIPCHYESVDKRASSLIDSADLARAVARAKVSSNLDLSLVDSTVTEKGDSWVVEFNLKPEHKHRTGGQAVVIVEKASGEVRSSYVGK